MYSLAWSFLTTHLRAQPRSQRFQGKALGTRFWRAVWDWTPKIPFWWPFWWPMQRPCLAVAWFWIFTHSNNVLACVASARGGASWSGTWEREHARGVDTRGKGTSPRLSHRSNLRLIIQGPAMQRITFLEWGKSWARQDKHLFFRLHIKLVHLIAFVGIPKLV